MVSIEDNPYTTVYEDDPNLAIGTEYVKQEGVDGVNRVTRKIKKVNGDIIEALPVSTEEIKPMVSRIVVRGQKQISGVGNLQSWFWPTARPYIISSTYGWRWGKMHEGYDIAGTGCGSPIYATNNGVVVQAGYTGTNGNYVYINHNNGYYSVYAHMDSIRVTEGQIVEGGQVIGTMGDSGFATGVHLHFAIYYGYPFLGGVSINPGRFL